MSRLKILPPGTLRRLRVKWFGIGLMLGGLAGVAVGAAPMVMRVMKGPTFPLIPIPKGGPALTVKPLAFSHVELPPCSGTGKMCDEDMPPPRARAVPLPAPLPGWRWDEPVTRGVPTAGTGALVAIGVGALMAAQALQKRRG